MSVSFQGMDQTVVTFRAADSLNAGAFASISGNGTVGSCSPGQAPMGLVLNKRNGYAAVQVRGYVEAEYSGTLNLGWRELTVENGKVRTSSSGENGRRCLVVSTDTTAKTACLFLW